MAVFTGSQHQQLIAGRIACPEAGYSTSEARFPDIKAWEEYYKEDWFWVEDTFPSTIKE